MNISEQIVIGRQNQKMTQEELAIRLGVTSQAVSKWERGAGLPDTAMLADICTILGIDANALLGISGNRSERADLSDAESIMLSSCAEPILISFGEDFIPVFMEGLKTDLISEKRRKLAREKGFVIPLIRIRDELNLKKNEYVITVYGKRKGGACPNEVTQEWYEKIVDEVFDIDEASYAELLNKQTVKMMVESCERNYPGVAAGVIPEQISYLECELIFREILKRGGSIRNQIRVLEQIEYEILLKGNRNYSQIAQEIAKGQFSASQSTKD